MKFYCRTLHDHRIKEVSKYYIAPEKSLRTDVFVQTKCNNELQ